MTPTISTLPLQGQRAGFRRFSVVEYHRLIQGGYLTEDDNLELIEGYLVHKMARNPPHDYSLTRLSKSLNRLVPSTVDVRVQCAITLSESEPEPDVALVRGPDRAYISRHPGNADILQTIEVSDSSLDSDRADKCRIYARAGIPYYWIVNLVDRQIEVYSQPSGPTPAPSYAHRQDYRSGDSVPLVLDGAVVGTIAVDDALP